MLLHEAIRSARKGLGLSQDRLAELAGIQRRRLSILENGGNVTLATLRKILTHLPNLQTFELGDATATVKRRADTQTDPVERAIEALANAIRAVAAQAARGELPDVPRQPERQRPRYGRGAAAAF